MARCLAEYGARHLVLVGRRAPSPAAQSVIEEIEQMGAAVSVAAADVSQIDDISRVLDRLDESGAPLAGVIHAAGVLADGAIGAQRWQGFVDVFAPKLLGAWNLHRLTRDLPLDFFVQFSSAASVLGSPGQANYTAANTFLDALGHFRRHAGLPATGINWGPWAQVGMAATTTSVERPVWRDATSIQPEQGVQLFNRIVAAGSGQVAVLPVDWSRLGSIWPGGTAPRILSGLVPKQVDDGAQAALHQAFIAELMATAPARRREKVDRYLRDQLLEVLGSDPDNPPDLSRGFFDLGLDSLMALELKNRLQAAIGRVIPVTLVFEHPTIEELSEYLVGQLLSEVDGDAEGRADSAPPTETTLAAVAATLESLSLEELTARVDPRRLEEVSGLSDEEVEARLAELVERQQDR
jgi:acyl carrier protein